MDGVILIGYSGHAYVVCDILEDLGRSASAYFEQEEKSYNPYSLEYLGSDQDEKVISILNKHDWFVAIGNNHLRKIVMERLLDAGVIPPSRIIHNSALISKTARLGDGVMVGAGAIINPLVQVDQGTIINTGSIVEHECKLGPFAHIAPGAVLAGNVQVGERSFVGANAVVKEGITIGDEVRIGAGSVVVKNIPDGMTVVGNPARVLE